jgi:hypothetical protein
MSRGRGLAMGLVVAAALARPAAAEAHVGSPDAVQDGQAGPYHLLVTIRPPDVVPGIAQIAVRTFDDDVAGVSVVPLPLRGPGVDSPPVADRARPSPGDAHLYDSTVWLMRTGAWQVRVTVNGARGAGALSIPVPALARAVRPMPAVLVGVLVALLLLLVTGFIAIVGAGLRESDLAAGALPDRRRRRRGRVGMAVATAVLALGILGGRSWWSGEARLYRRLLYKPMRVVATQASPATLTLALSDPGWMRWREIDDLVPDHGHLMHLFLVRAPGLDAIAHLHPRLVDTARFDQATPPLPAGSYRLFGDIVHRTGLDETVSTEVALAGPPPTPTGDGGHPPDPATAADLLPGRFDPDDAIALIPRAAGVGSPVFAFADGRGQLRWLAPRAPRAGETVSLELEAESPDGLPAPGIQAYMGMAGHAMIVARDFSVFAHIHPTGSVPMAALALVEGAPALPDHSHHAMTFAPRVRFPCVFPHAGPYRLFVQIKEHGRVETAAFDFEVLPAPEAAQARP